MIWNPNKECMSRDEMHDLQGKRLQKLVGYVYHNVPFYRNKMQELDIAPEDIKSIEDITKLPFTTKQDLPSKVHIESFAGRSLVGDCARACFIGNYG